MLSRGTGGLSEGLGGGWFGGWSGYRGDSRKNGQGDGRGNGWGPCQGVVGLATGQTPVIHSTTPMRGYYRLLARSGELLS